MKYITFIDIECEVSIHIAVNYSYLCAVLMRYQYHSDGHVVSGTDSSVNGASSSPAWIQVFSAAQGHCTAAFYDAFTGPTEFIISIVNSVKMVNFPSSRREKVSVYYLLLYNDVISITLITHVYQETRWLYFRTIYVSGIGRWGT